MNYVKCLEKNVCICLNQEYTMEKMSQRQLLGNFCGIKHYTIMCFYHLNINRFHFVVINVKCCNDMV